MATNNTDATPDERHDGTDDADATASNDDSDGNGESDADVGDVVAAGHAALMGDDSTAVREAASKIERVAAAQSEAGLWALAGEMRLIVEDFDGGIAAFRAAHQLLPADEKIAAQWRMGGAAIWRSLGGPTLFSMLLQAGRALAALEANPPWRPVEHVEAELQPFVHQFQRAGFDGLELAAADWAPFVTASFGDRCANLLELGASFAQIFATTTTATAVDEARLNELRQLVWPVLFLLRQAVDNALVADLQSALLATPETLRACIDTIFTAH